MNDYAFKKLLLALRLLGDARRVVDEACRIYEWPELAKSEEKRAVNAISGSLTNCVQSLETLLTVIEEPFVDELDVNKRVVNALRRGGYLFIGQVSQASDNELLRIQGFGVGMLRKIRFAIRERQDRSQTT